MALVGGGTVPPPLTTDLPPVKGFRTNSGPGAQGQKVRIIFPLLCADNFLANLAIFPKKICPKLHFRSILLHAKSVLLATPLFLGEGSPTSLLTGGGRFGLPPPTCICRILTAPQGLPKAKGPANGNFSVDGRWSNDTGNQSLAGFDLFSPKKFKCFHPFSRWIAFFISSRN